MRTITSVIEVDAPPEAVWHVLTDTAAHSHWNPFITEFQGDLQVGSRIAIQIAPPGGRPMSFHPTITHLEPERKVAWLGRLLLPGLFDGAHSFTLEPLAEGRTRLVQSETFRGVLVWFSGRLLQNTEAGFRAMNEALRRRVAELNPA
jgi:hypothetical protein